MAQFARPISDITVGSWTTTPLWDKIDESVASDTDFIESNNNTNETVEVAMSSVSTPAAGTVTVRYRYAYGTSGSNARTIQVALVQGTTVIATGTAHTPASSAFTDGSFTVATSAITNFSDLRLRFIVGGTTGGPRPQPRARGAGARQ